EPDFELDHRTPLLGFAGIDAEPRMDRRSRDMDAQTDAGEAALALDSRRDPRLDRKLDDLAGEPQHEGAGPQLIAPGRIDLNSPGQPRVVHHVLDVEVLGVRARPGDLGPGGGSDWSQPFQEGVVDREDARVRGPGRVSP